MGTTTSIGHLEIFKFHGIYLVDASNLLNRYLHFGLMEPQILAEKAVDPNTHILVAENIIRRTTEGYLQGKLIQGELVENDIIGKPEGLSQFINPYLKEGRVLLLESVVLNPEYRGCGIISTMVQRMVSETKPDFVISFTRVNNEEEVKKCSHSKDHTQLYKRAWFDSHYPCERCGQRCSCDALAWMVKTK